MIGSQVKGGAGLTEACQVSEHSVLYHAFFVVSLFGPRVGEEHQDSFQSAMIGHNVEKFVDFRFQEVEVWDGLHFDFSIRFVMRSMPRQ